MAEKSSVEYETLLCRPMRKRPVIVHVFDGFRVGGTEVRTCRIINALQDLYRHVIVSCNGDFSARILIDSTVDIEFIHPSHLIGAPRLNLIAGIFRFLRRLSPDLLVAYEWGAIDWVLANQFAKVCPTLMTIEGFEETEIQGQIPKRWMLRRLLYHRCDRVVVCSKMLCQLAIQSWKITSSGQLLHIPNGIDCAKFSPGNKGNNEVVTTINLGIVGSLIKLKNHKKLLLSVEKLARNITIFLYIVGDGPEREKLQQLCEELKITEKVHFTGAMQDPSGILRKLDVYCLTSDTEQMPMVVLEAMACGLPVVATDVGDVREMVAKANKNYIVDKNSDLLFDHALARLCGDKQLRQSIGLANMHKCRAEYDERFMFQRYRDIYSSLICTASHKENEGALLKW
jgi:glycosyltransferase involved in cell wall biosynthesis